MSAKQEILERIRAANASGTAASSETAHAEIARTYLQAGRLTREEAIALFIDRLEDYGAVVYRCDENDLQATIANALQNRSKSSLLVPAGLELEWLAPGIRWLPDENLSYEDLDRSEGVLTGCALAIALTGTIVLRHGPGDARRALTLVPDYHLCVVFESQVVETVPEAIRAISEFAKHPITTISGPSATADIEMTRIKGVHGPRTLDVVLLRAKSSEREFPAGTAEAGGE